MPVLARHGAQAVPPPSPSPRRPRIATAAGDLVGLCRAALDRVRECGGPPRGDRARRSRGVALAAVRGGGGARGLLLRQRRLAEHRAAGTRGALCAAGAGREGRAGRAGRARRRCTLRAGHGLQGGADQVQDSDRRVPARARAAASHDRLVQPPGQQRHEEPALASHVGGQGESQDRHLRAMDQGRRADRPQGRGALHRANRRREARHGRVYLGRLHGVRAHHVDVHARHGLCAVRAAHDRRRRLLQPPRRAARHRKAGGRHTAL
jgi:hypothetical protein